MMCEWKRAGSGLILLALMAALTGCGVKSSPAFPEGAAYPLVYPSLRDKPVAAAPDAPRSTYTARPAAPGEYVPPPPATDMSVK